MTARLRIGLTGGIASGKSTVAKRFMELGIPVIDADESARRVVAVGQAGLTEVVRRFGSGILTAGGELDRGALRALVFAEPERRRELESILHPLIRADMDRRAGAAPGRYVVFEIPLLVEGGTSDRVDRILVVDLPEATQLERAVERDGGTLEQARAIVAVQATRERRLRSADDVLDNSGTVADLRRSVDVLHERYLKLSPHGSSSGKT